MCRLWRSFGWLLCPREESSGFGDRNIVDDSLFAGEDGTDCCSCCVIGFCACWAPALIFAQVVQLVSISTVSALWDV
jgi:hypothetical protein